MALPQSLIDSKAQDQLRVKSNLRYYKTWAAKPGNLQAKALEAKEQYHFRASLGICPISGCPNDVPQGRKTCGHHWEKKGAKP